jgi:hypothetical protein
MKQYGKELHTIGAGREPIYRFIEQDQYNIKLQRIGNMKEYILIDKQSLQSFSRAFSKLAKEFTK